MPAKAVCVQSDVLLKNESASRAGIISISELFYQARPARKSLPHEGLSGAYLCAAVPLSYIFYKLIKR